MRIFSAKINQLGENAIQRAEIAPVDTLEFHKMMFFSTFVGAWN